VVRMASARTLTERAIKRTDAMRASRPVDSRDTRRHHKEMSTHRTHQKEDEESQSGKHVNDAARHSSCSGDRSPSSAGQPWPSAHANGQGEQQNRAARSTWLSDRLCIRSALPHASSSSRSNGRCMVALHLSGCSDIETRGACAVAIRIPSISVGSRLVVDRASSACATYTDAIVHFRGKIRARPCIASLTHSLVAPHLPATLRLLTVVGRCTWTNSIGRETLRPMQRAQTERLAVTFTYYCTCPTHLDVHCPHDCDDAKSTTLESVNSPRKDASHEPGQAWCRVVIPGDQPTLL
jgi:hypothetical protein